MHKKWDTKFYSLDFCYCYQPDFGEEKWSHIAYLNLTGDNQIMNIVEGFLNTFSHWYQTMISEYENLGEEKEKEKGCYKEGGGERLQIKTSTAFWFVSEL